MRSLVFAGLLLIATFAPLAPIRAQATDAAARIDGFYGTLLETMKRAKLLGPKGRYERLAPIVANTFDVAGMMRIATGVTWEKVSTTQKIALVDAFSRMIAANYASRFDDFNGERFEVIPAIDQPPSDKLVKTLLVQSENRIVALNYLMHNTSNGWKVADIYLEGNMSQLAIRRAEFQSIIKSGGPEGLIAALRQKADILLGGR
jgi:phospholipid transport system substrate-binding protein